MIRRSGCLKQVEGPFEIMFFSLFYKHGQTEPRPLVSGQ